MASRVVRERCSSELVLARHAAIFIDCAEFDEQIDRRARYREVVIDSRCGQGKDIRLAGGDKKK